MLVGRTANDWEGDRDGKEMDLAIEYGKISEKEFNCSDRWDWIEETNDVLKNKGGGYYVSRSPFWSYSKPL